MRQIFGEEKFVGMCPRPYDGAQLWPRSELRQNFQASNIFKESPTANLSLSNKSLLLQVLNAIEMKKF